MCKRMYVRYSGTRARGRTVRLYSGTAEQIRRRPYSCTGNLARYAASVEAQYYYRYYPYGCTDLTFCLYRYRYTASTSVRWYTADYMQGWLNKPQVGKGTTSYLYGTR